MFRYRFATKLIFFLSLCCFNSIKSLLFFFLAPSDIFKCGFWAEVELFRPSCCLMSSSSQAETGRGNNCKLNVPPSPPVHSVRELWRRWRRRRRWRQIVPQIPSEIMSDGSSDNGTKMRFLSGYLSVYFKYGRSVASFKNSQNPVARTGSIDFLAEVTAGAAA